MGDRGRNAAPRAGRAIVWPAYLVAAVCFALAVALSLFNLSLIEQLKTAEAQTAQVQQRSMGLVHDVSSERNTIEDLMDPAAQRYSVTGGEIVRVRDRLYITMHDMAQPPHGKVYEAWTIPRGAKTPEPSLTFLPDAHGVAVVALPPPASATQTVEVSIEPDGGSKAPTGTPLIVQPLN
jgi:hypothetical protein